MSHAASPDVLTLAAGNDNPAVVDQQSADERQFVLRLAICLKVGWRPGWPTIQHVLDDLLQFWIMHCRRMKKLQTLQRDWPVRPSAKAATASKTSSSSLA